jgi:hypothetical protein
MVVGYLTVFGMFLTCWIKKIESGQIKKMWDPNKLSNLFDLATRNEVLMKRVKRVRQLIMKRTRNNKYYNKRKGERQTNTALVTVLNLSSVKL